MKRGLTIADRAAVVTEGALVGPVTRAGNVGRQLRALHRKEKGKGTWEAETMAAAPP